MASIWTEAPRTWASAADGKARAPSESSRIFVAVPWRFDVIRHTSRWSCWAASMACSRDSEYIQALGPLSSSRADSGSPMHSRNRGWCKGSPCFPDGWAKSEDLWVILRKAQTPGRTPRRPNEEVPTEMDPPGLNATAEQGSQTQPEVVRSDCRRHCKRRNPKIQTPAPWSRMMKERVTTSVIPHHHPNRLTPRGRWRKTSHRVPGMNTTNQRQRRL